MPPEHVKLRGKVVKLGEGGGASSKNWGGGGGGRQNEVVGDVCI